MQQNAALTVGLANLNEYKAKTIKPPNYKDRRGILQSNPRVGEFSWLNSLNKTQGSARGDINTDMKTINRYEELIDLTTTEKMDVDITPFQQLQYVRIRN